MRPILTAAVIALASGPVLAQSADSPAAVRHHKTHHVQPNATGHTGEKPVDAGPNTPEANRAYQGGGVVLEGAPGAPAPKPQPTPPGQTPRNAVPQ